MGSTLHCFFFGKTGAYTRSTCGSESEHFKLSLNPKFELVIAVSNAQMVQLGEFYRNTTLKIMENKNEPTETVVKFFGKLMFSKF